MSKIIHIFLIFILLINCSKKNNTNNETLEASGDELKGSIQLSGAFALYPMAISWAEEFRKLHPHVKIDISGGGAGKGMTDVLVGVVDIGMMSREVYAEEINQGAFPISVVKDAVVPMINSNNPLIAEIKKKGLSKENARKLWNKEIKTWGQFLNTSSSLPIHIFTRSDACGAAETFAAWLGKRQENLRATAVFGDPGIASAIQKDKMGIGYNNIAYAYDNKTKKTFEGLTVIPIDLNDDGIIDQDEDFYDTIDGLIAAINDRKFPSPPARDLYFVTKGKPTDPIVLAFLEYILTEGQQYAYPIGFIALSPEVAEAQLQQLSNN